MQWEQLKRVIENKDYSKFYREVSVLKSYDNFVKTILREWETLGDYVLHTVFDLEFSLSCNFKKYVKTDVIRKSRKRHMITCNDFPYALKGIDHYILWLLDQENYVSYIEERFPRDEYKVLYFQNSKDRQSVNNVQHIHIFCKRR